MVVERLIYEVENWEEYNEINIYARELSRESDIRGSL
jgi:hypothetical protein